MLQHAELTDSIIKAFYKVYNTLGHGFLEKVYEKSLAIELHRAGMAVKSQHPIEVLYEAEVVGQYHADLIVEDLVILELKAAAALDKAHEAQLLNYLRATNIEVGLLLNFGLKPEFKRKIFMNDKKEPEIERGLGGLSGSTRIRAKEDPHSSARSVQIRVHFSKWRGNLGGSGTRIARIRRIDAD